MRRYIEAYGDPDAFYNVHKPDVPHDRRHRPDRMSAAKVVPLLLDVASSFEPKDEKPGFTTFAGWMRMWKRYRDWKLMAPLYHLRGSSDRSVIVGPMKRIIDRAIKRVWMTRGQETKEAVCEAVEYDIGRYNERHPEKPIGVSRRQICRYMADEIDKYEEAVARKGKRWADKRFKPVFSGARRRPHYAGGGGRPHPGQARGDGRRHWREPRQALDHGGDLPPQPHGGGDPHPLRRADAERDHMQCLRNVMMPNTFLKLLVPELDYDYPCCGVPESYFFDRGRDFDSDHVREVCLNFDIRPLYAPGDNPEYKGSIERFFGTLHKQVALTVKGATPRVKDRDSNRRPRKSEAVMAFSDFAARVWHWLAMVYAKEFHEGLGDIPVDVWKESSRVRAPRPPPSKDKVGKYLMRAVRCEPTVQNVRQVGLIWNGEVIKRIRSHPGHRRGDEILVRIDDNDVGRAFATDPVTGSLEPLDPVLDRYMPRTSMHQHELVMRKVKQKRDGTHSERSLMEAKRRLREQAIESLSTKTTTSKTRARLARFFNIGATAPAGDDLGSLDPRKGTTRAARKTTATPKARPGATVDAPATPDPVPAPHTLGAPRARRSGPARRLG